MEKIIYNTQTENFTFHKRNLMGLDKTATLSRFKIVYTENAVLNSRGTNYFDIDTKEQFSIAYKYAWRKQDLFSHLISQRIVI